MSGAVKTVRKTWNNLTGETSADAAKKASRIQSTAANEAAGNIQSMYESLVPSYGQYTNLGTNAVTGLNNLISAPSFGQVTPFTFNQDDPSYQWRFNQGADALAAQASAMGQLGSGNLGTALVDYGQNAASQEYQNAYNRWYQQQALNQSAQNQAYNQLFGLGQMGFGATEDLSNLGMGSAISQGNLKIGASNAIGSGLVNAANAQTAAYNNLLNTGMQGAGIIAALL